MSKKWWERKEWWDEGAKNNFNKETVIWIGMWRTLYNDSNQSQKTKHFHFFLFLTCLTLLYIFIYFVLTFIIIIIIIFHLVSKKLNSDCGLFLESERKRWMWDKRLCFYSFYKIFTSFPLFTLFVSFYIILDLLGWRPLIHCSHSFSICFSNGVSFFKFFVKIDSTLF